MWKGLSLCSPEVFGENLLSARRKNKLLGLHHPVALLAPDHLKLSAEFFLKKLDFPVIRCTEADEPIYINCEHRSESSTEVIR